MKKAILFILLYLTFTNIKAQISTSINNVYLNSQTTVSNCNTLDFGTVQNNNLVFYFKLSRPSSLPSGTGTLRIMFKLNSSATPQVIGSPQNILDSFWTNTLYESTINCNISASQVQQSGSSIYLEFETSGNIKTSSCSYPITKTLTPSFTLSPTSLSLPCGSTSSRTFTVTPANIPSGAIVTYQWSIGNGWSGNVGNGNSITLTPTSASILPSSVTVTPSINGVAQSSKTCTVSRPTFTTSATINGSATLCATGIYTMNNLPSGVTIESASSSNTNVATVSVNNGQITATKVSNGTFTLTVTLRNACLQPATKTKTIQAGENANIGITGLENGINAGGTVSLSLTNTNGCGTITFTSASSGLTFVHVGPDYAVLSSTSSNSGTGWVYISISGGTSIYREFPINVIPPPVLPDANYISVARIENNYNVYPYNQWKMVKAYYYGNSSDVTYWEWNIGTSYYAKPNDTSVIFLFQSSSNVTVNVRACNNNGCSSYVSTVIN